uniref:TRAP transporter small permease n=1 Tax=Pararhizobium sp. IMCC3301 TaxID=3067904 RepID=UPI00274250E8|nr:TRAP transporter small permease [Pararhizobium sp. IMCC3301]
MLTRAGRAIIRDPEISLGMIILLAFIILATLQVGTRYLTGQQFIWTEELSSILIIWLTFIGAAGVERRYGHIRVELAQDIFPQRVVRWLYAFFDLIIIFSLVCLLVAGWQNTLEMTFQKTPAMRLPWRYILLAVPIAASLMLVYTIRNLINRLRGRPVYPDVR